MACGRPSGVKKGRRERGRSVESVNGKTGVYVYSRKNSLVGLLKPKIPEEL